ncbi:MAG: prepilin-type N-terminal cleavage/methylation domain-containing protein [Candidatus Pacebacteria bacterium]|nr:prepilin-type N-terminal cleavage/methylation domain-containing protein [Candidatus Paceibacterota bacterium]
MKSFTLPEILVVIGIIGILALFALPALRAFQPNLQLSSVTQELVADLRYAQQLTVTEQKEHCLLFFPSEKKYQLKECQGAVLKEKILPKEIESITPTGFTGDEVKYNPYGAVSEPGTVVLENTKKETKTISIKASGFVEVVE